MTVKQFILSELKNNYGNVKITAKKLGVGKSSIYRLLKEKTEREPGYYWVEYGRKKRIAEYTGESWLIFGFDKYLKDNNFNKIYEDKICNP